MSQDLTSRGSHPGLFRLALLVPNGVHIEGSTVPCLQAAVGGVGGDAITEMLGLLRKSPQTGQAKSIHHMITQLVQRKTSTADGNSSRRASFYPAGYSEHAHRLSGESTGLEDSSTHTTHLSSEEYPQRPGLDQRRAHTAFDYASRRHTVSTVPGFRVKSSPYPKK